MHVRGGPLSHPKAVNALAPFIVSFWAQKNEEDPPPDVKALYQASGRGFASNVRYFVLDADGRMVHCFSGFPGRRPHPMGLSLDEQAAYLIDELARANVALPKVSPSMKLPDVADGVRLFVRLPDQRGTYATPVVEVVADQGEWKALAKPSSRREIDAGRLARWLKLCYPPGVNEQLHPYDAVEGKLALRPLDARTAILSGSVRLSTRDRADHPFEGTFEAVVTYAGDSVSLRGVLDGVYPRFDTPRGRWMDWKLVAAIESRPN
jgi:hypothetical protein